MLYEIKLRAAQKERLREQPTRTRSNRGAGSVRSGETPFIKTAVHSFLRMALFGILFFGMTLAAAEPLTVQISLDDAPTAGVEMPVHITVNAKISARDITLPEISGARRLTGIVSQRFSSSYDSRRGASTSTTMSFLILPERAGEVVIPPVVVKEGRRQGQSAPYRFKVLPSGAPVISADGKALDAPFGTMEILPARKLYAGETATMLLHLVVPGKMSINGATPPEVTGLTDVSFVTRRKGNQSETFRFSQPRRDQNGTIQLTGSADFRLLGAGKFTPNAAMTLAVVVPQKRRSFFDDDDFFAPFAAVRTTPRKVIFNCKTPIEVLPLPPPPKGAYDLGLVGIWQLKCAVNKPEVKTGEAVELILTASGSGGTENFRAPQLGFPGFRLYPPEVRREDGEASARYVMIPLAVGNPRLKFSVTAFNAEKGHYEVTDFDLPLSVKQGSAALPPPSVSAPVMPDEPSTSAPQTPRDELNYQKSGKGKLVAVPLIVNNIVPVAVLLLAALLLLLGAWLLPRLRRNDAQQLARRELRKKLNALRRALKAGGDPKAVCREYGVSAIAEALGLAPGATASEIAEACKNEAVLARFFADLDASGFAPGSVVSGTADSQQSRRALLKLLGRIMPLLLLTAMPALGAQELNAAFNRGDYGAAIRSYQEALGKNSGALSPDLLYNLGNAYFRAGDLPRARVALEQAKMLAPRDAEIRDNSALVRSALQLPSETGRIAALRDRWRPDEYIVIAAAAVAILSLLVLLRRRMPLPVLTALTGIILLALILALCAAVSQAQSSYSPTRAVLIGKSIEVRALPAVGGSVVSRLAGGSDAEIIEKRGSWIRVHTSGGDGWIPSEKCSEIFPYGIL